MDKRIDVIKQVQKNVNGRIYVAGMMFTEKFFKICCRFAE